MSMEEVLSATYGTPDAPEVTTTQANEEDKITRQRFNNEHDETLLQEVLNVQPYSAKFGSTIEQWKTIAAIFNEKYGRSASWKTLQNRTRKLLKNYKPKHSPNRRLTGLERLLYKCSVMRDKSCHTTNKELRNANKLANKNGNVKKLITVGNTTVNDGKNKRRRTRDSVDSNGSLENSFSYDEEEPSASMLEFQKQKLEFEREKWQKEMEFRERKLAVKERQMELQERRFALESDERMALINTLLHRTETRLSET